MNFPLIISRSGLDPEISETKRGPEPQILELGGGGGGGLRAAFVLQNYNFSVFFKIIKGLQKCW